MKGGGWQVLDWSPLPVGWERQPALDLCATAPAGSLAIPHKLFEHRAVLYAADQTPVNA